MKNVIGNAIIEHVTVGEATTIAELARISKREMALLQVERARFLGFEVDELVCEGGFRNRVERTRKSLLADFAKHLQSEYLNWGVYSSVLIMGAAAEAIKRTIVVWVAHPSDPTALQVYRAHGAHGGTLAIHSPRSTDGVIHLRFFKASDETNPDVSTWGAGFGRHFELLREPVNGWPQRNAGLHGNNDDFTPL